MLGSDSDKARVISSHAQTLSPPYVLAHLSLSKTPLPLSLKGKALSSSLDPHAAASGLLGRHACAPACLTCFTAPLPTPSSSLVRPLCLLFAGAAPHSPSVLGRLLPSHHVGLYSDATCSEGPGQDSRSELVLLPVTLSYLTAVSAPS